MSYEKQTWMTGDIITAEKLNYMEDGIAESGTGSDNLVEVVNIEVTWTGDSTYSATADKTLEQLIEASAAGKAVVGHIHIIPNNQPDYFWSATAMTIMEAYGGQITFARPWVLYEGASSAAMQTVTITTNNITISRWERNF